MDSFFTSAADTASTSPKADGYRLLEAIKNNRVYNAIITRTPDLDVNVVDKYGRTSLHWAAMGGENDIVTVEFLVNSGARVDVQDIYGFIPLHLAVYNSSMAVVRALFPGETEINLKDAHGKSALHWAVSSIREDATAIVDFLLKNGANSNALDNNGYTPLHYAVQNKEFGVVMAKQLFIGGTDFNARSTDGHAFTALYLAVQTGCYSTEMAKQLSEGGANPNLQDRYGCTPLHWAIPNPASGVINQEVVKRLCEYGASATIADGNGWIPLHNAASYASLAVLECLLNTIPPKEVPLLIDLPDKYGKTALHWAVHNKTPDRLRIVQALVQYGAFRGAKDKHGLTPRNHVNEYQQDNEEVIQALCNEKLDYNNEVTLGAQFNQMSLSGS